MMNAKPALILTITFVFLSLTAFEAQAYDTENVFVVVIDGLRNEEAFDDPSHQYIPYIWNSLRPMGTIYTEFYNDYFSTYTTPGHEAIVSGQWHFHPNLYGGGFYDCRPEAPTIFEYYREHTGLPQEKTMVVTGKANNIQLDWSLEPSHGPDYASLMFEGASDDYTYDLLATKLAEHHPKLVLVNFRDVDAMGHTNVWQDYIDAIVNADYLVNRVWNELIQGDPFYANKTTMILTSDHGRNDDTVGFANHGGISHQNRHVLYLAMGPDTPAGQTITERRYLIDIAPTVGELLDFPTPFSHGQVMTDIFHSYLNPDPRVRVYAKNPRMAGFFGGAWVTWSENTPDDMGNERVYLRRKLPGDPSFSDPILINDPTVARWAFYPSVAANINGVHVAWLDGRALVGDKETWSIFYRKSTDWGISWQAEQLIATSTFESAQPGTLEILGEPEIIATRAGELIISVKYRGGIQWREMVSYRTTNGGITWNEFDVQLQTRHPRNYCPLALTFPWEAVVTWNDFGDTPGQTNTYNWEVFFKRTLNGGNSWITFQRLSLDSGYSDKPRIAWNGQNLVTVWAERSVQGGPFDLIMTKSSNKGSSWSANQSLGLGTSPWQPSLAWNIVGGEFHLLFTDYSSAYPDVKRSKSQSGSSWTAPVIVSPNPKNSYRRNPQIIASLGQLYGSWEEYDPSTTEWSITVEALSN